MADGEGAIDSGIPTREEVRSHFAEMGFAVDPDRFFDVNEGRGWRTNSGKPVDDWKKLAAVWDRNEHPKATTPPARTEPKANAVGKIPSVEEVSRLTLLLCVGIAIGVAVVIYGVLVLALHCIRRSDLELLPKGDKLARLLHIS